MADLTECTSTLGWHHPLDVMKLHKLKQKRKKALQLRNLKQISTAKTASEPSLVEDTYAKKRSNPFSRQSYPKRIKSNIPIPREDCQDGEILKLLHQDAPSFKPSENCVIESYCQEEVVEVVKSQDEKCLPIDWSLTNKLRLISSRPFPWNQKLKMSEEADSLTTFTRCLDNSRDSALATSPNARFHQCCLYWQQPCLPWLTLFPRSSSKLQPTTPVMNSVMRDSLQQAWTDGLRSLLQLLRVGQCPYFYVCTNTFTVLFRAAGVCGFSDVHAVVSPTTKGFRQMLRREDVGFTMPLKDRISDQVRKSSDSSNEEEDDENDDDESWMKSMGITNEDIKQINYTQQKIVHKAECEVDNSEQSLVLVEGAEIHAFFNFLINCKSTTAATGPLAGVPPTLLAPVAFLGASLNSLKVRESKVYQDGADHYCTELSGPILPSTIHNLFAVNSLEYSMIANFNNIRSTECFNKLNNTVSESEVVENEAGGFGKKNLSDSGLLPKVLERFCAADMDYVTTVEFLKYSSENKTYSWA